MSYLYPQFASRHASPLPTNVGIEDNQNGDLMNLSGSMDVPQLTHVVSSILKTMGKQSKCIESLEQELSMVKRQSKQEIDELKIQNAKLLNTLQSWRQESTVALGELRNKCELAHTAESMLQSQFCSVGLDLSRVSHDVEKVQKDVESCWNGATALVTDLRNEIDVALSEFRTHFSSEITELRSETDQAVGELRNTVTGPYIAVIERQSMNGATTRPINQITQLLNFNSAGRDKYTPPPIHHPSPQKYTQISNQNPFLNPSLPAQHPIPPPTNSLPQMSTLQRTGPVDIPNQQSNNSIPMNNGPSNLPPPPSMANLPPVPTSTQKPQLPELPPAPAPKPPVQLVDTSKEEREKSLANMGAGFKMRNSST